MVLFLYILLILFILNQTIIYTFILFSTQNKKYKGGERVSNFYKTFLNFYFSNTFFKLEILLNFLLLK